MKATSQIRIDIYTYLWAHHIEGHLYIDILIPVIEVIYRTFLTKLIEGIYRCFDAPAELAMVMRWPWLASIQSGRKALTVQKCAIEFTCTYERL